MLAHLKNCRLQKKSVHHRATTPVVTEGSFNGKSHMLVCQMMTNDERGGRGVASRVVGNEKGAMGGMVREAAGCDDGAALRLVLKKRFKHHLLLLFSTKNIPTGKGKKINLRHRNGHQQILCKKCKLLFYSVFLGGRGTVHF